MRKGGGETGCAVASLSTHREILRTHKVVGALVPALEVKFISIAATDVRISTGTGTRTCQGRRKQGWAFGGRWRRGGWYRWRLGRRCRWWYRWRHSWRRHWRLRASSTINRSGARADAAEGHMLGIPASRERVELQDSSYQPGRRSSPSQVDMAALRLITLTGVAHLVLAQSTSSKVERVVTGTSSYRGEQVLIATGCLISCLYVLRGDCTH